jgi:hypothetical protein
MTTKSSGANEFSTNQAATSQQPIRELPTVRIKPVHEVRMGRIKAAIWANESESGLRYNVTLRRLYKRDGATDWEQSDSFGRDDLPLVMEVSRAAWMWIFATAQQS